MSEHNCTRDVVVRGTDSETVAQGLAVGEVRVPDGFEPIRTGIHRTHDGWLVVVRGLCYGPLPCDERQRLHTVLIDETELAALYGDH